MIVMRILVGNLHPEKYAVIQQHTQAGNINTNLRVKVEFALSALSSMDFLTCKFHVDESAKGGFDMILGQDLLTESWLKL